MSKEKQFWDWFKKNEAKYFFLNQIDDNDEKEKLLNDFLDHLHKYCDQLFFEIGGHPDEKQDLIITAEGDTDYFPQVESLAGSSPELEHWKVIAFKPVRADYILGFGDIKLDPKTMFFIPLNNKNSEKLGLRLYIEGYTKTNEKDFLTASYLILDNILGEKSNALDIGYVEVEDLSSVPDKDELIELNKLPRYIQWKKSKANG